jgi:hypothetical protein
MLILAVGCEWHASCDFQEHDSNRSNSRDTQRTDSRVLLPRVSFANVRPRPHRGDSFDPLGVGTLTLPPAGPPHAGRWAVSASVEPFIVFRSDVRMSASRAHYSPTSTLDDVAGYGRFENTLCA